MPDDPLRTSRSCRCCPARAAPSLPRGSIRAEARAWRDVIDALPGQWVDAASQLVLRRVAAQIAVTERLEDHLRRLGEMPTDPEALEAEKAVAAMHRETAKAIIHGLTALRATPRSRMAAREGRSRFERGAPSFRPWDIVAQKSGSPDGPAS
jgi:hypothetical protein